MVGSGKHLSELGVRDRVNSCHSAKAATKSRIFYPERECRTPNAERHEQLRLADRQISIS